MLNRVNKAIKDSGKEDLCEVDAKLGKFKDEGNKKYQEKKY